MPDAGGGGTLGPAYNIVEQSETPHANSSPNLAQIEMDGCMYVQILAHIKIQTKHEPAATSTCITVHVRNLKKGLPKK